MIVLAVYLTGAAIYAANVIDSNFEEEWFMDLAIIFLWPAVVGLRIIQVIKGEPKEQIS